MSSTTVSGISASYAGALRTASDAASSQHYPPGALYVVATPIGNLADISLRALHVLSLADAIACEDTRHTQALLRAYGIDKSLAQLLAVHQHNEAQASLLVIDRLRLGQRVVYVSDAGTPAISDPGARLVAAVRAQALPVVPLPGPSSITTALSVAGITGEFSDKSGGESTRVSDGLGQFVFIGFLPAKSMERTQAVLAMAAEPRTIVLLEAPHRIEAVANALATLGDRRITIGRELTKQFEEIATVRASDFAGWLAEQPNRSRGEFVLVLHPAPVMEQPGAELKVLTLLMAELPLKTAVKLAADITGAPRNTLYDAALLLKKTSEASG